MRYEYKAAGTLQAGSTIVPGVKNVYATSAQAVVRAVLPDPSDTGRVVVLLEDGRWFSSTYQCLIQVAVGFAPYRIKARDIKPGMRIRLAAGGEFSVSLVGRDTRPGKVVVRGERFPVRDWHPGGIIEDWADLDADDEVEVIEAKK